MCFVDKAIQIGAEVLCRGLAVILRSAASRRPLTTPAHTAGLYIAAMFASTPPSRQPVR